MRVNFLASETGASKYTLKVFCLNGECFQNLVSNPEGLKKVSTECRFILQ